MNEQEHHDKLVKQLLQEAQEQNKEFLFQAIQVGKNETSDLVGEIKDDHKLILSKVDAIEKHLSTLNGSVAKHNDKLAQHDIINAQVTITQQQILESLKELKTTDIATLKKSEEDNTTYRNQALGSLNTFKWLFGFLGIGNIVMFLKIVFHW